MLAEENFDWERPRIRRAEEFRRLQLLHKGRTGLGENRAEKQQGRAMAEQRRMVKRRVEAML